MELGSTDRSDLATPAATIATHALDVTAVERWLKTDSRHGLTEYDAASRLESTGPNELEGAPPAPLWHKALAQFRDPLVILLLVATGISLLAWGLEGADGAPFEAIIIAIIVVANAVIGLWQEARAEAAVAALQRMAAPTAEVVRDGEQRQVPAAEVVPGDLLVVGEGAAVCADARLVITASLKVAEAPLTGESEPVLKDIAVVDDATGIGDRTNTLFQERRLRLEPAGLLSPERGWTPRSAASLPCSAAPRKVRRHCNRRSPVLGGY